MRYSIPRKSRRVPLVTEVHLKLEELPDPVTAVTTNVSLGGMSVSIQRPAEIGSLAAFELEVGGALVEGTGEVAWIRGAAEGTDQPSGMGIRFRYLSPGSRERIFRLVQWYANQGGAATGEAVAAASPALSPPPGGLRSPAPKKDPLESTSPGLAASAVPKPLLAPSGRLVPTVPEPLVPDDLLSELSLAPLPGAPPIAEPPAPELRVPEPPTRPAEEAGLEQMQWLSVDDLRKSEPEPALELPAAPEEATVSPAEIAALRGGGSPARVSAAPARGAGYARSRRFRPLSLLAGLLLLGLALLAAWSWWPNLPLLFGQGGSLPSPAGGAAGETREVEVSIPSREDATRTLPADPAASEPAPVMPPATQPTPSTEEVASSATAPPPSPEPQAAPPTPTASLGPARQVNRISWEKGEGFTTLVLEADGAFKASGASASLLSGDSPRVLLKLKGIERKYPQDKLQVGTPQVAGVRIGLHDQNSGPELWVVLDLRARNLELGGTKISGNELRLTVRTQRQ